MQLVEAAGVRIAPGAALLRDVKLRDLARKQVREELASICPFVLDKLTPVPPQVKRHLFEIKKIRPKKTVMLFATNWNVTRWASVPQQFCSHYSRTLQRPKGRVLRSRDHTRPNSLITSVSLRAPVSCPCTGNKPTTNPASAALSANLDVMASGSTSE